MKHVVLIADSAAALRSVRFVLRNSGQFRVVASLDGRVPVRPTLEKLRPHLVLVDQMCQRTNSLARIREVSSEMPLCMVIVLTDARDAAYCRDALEAGADAVLCRRLHPATFATLLGEVLNGSMVSVPRLRAGSLAAHAPAARTSA